MQPTDPLDLVPQVPQDWANHIIYGGASGIVFFSLAALVDLPFPGACATEAVLLIASLKKAWDFVYEHESVEMCVGKALVTAVWPASIAAVLAAVSNG